MFSPDCASRRDCLYKAINGARILIVGGAGSIGSATVVELLAFEPSALCVLDTNENNLAELVRMLHTRDKPFRGTLEVQPLDYGTQLARRFLETRPAFDFVLSFAALKHVRSERDEFSVVRMLQVNLLAADYFLETLRLQGHGRLGVFFVSTDKAARPASVMGASKRLMERLLCAHAESAVPGSILTGGGAIDPLPRITSARFANVAFSDGSLPWSFLQRIQKGQPLAIPSNVRRYVFSPIEAGQLCLLAAIICPNKHLLVPRLGPTSDLVSFRTLVTATLRAFQYEPTWYADPDEARSALSVDLSNGLYPVVLGECETDGEKAVEEFLCPGEELTDIGLLAADGVAMHSDGGAGMMKLLATVEDATKAGEVPSKDALVMLISQMIPDFVHHRTGKTLDNVM
jgi:nucleoside-diphosphate-sugar epimerase